LLIQTLFAMQNENANLQSEFAKLIGSRSGGVYMPPARLCALQAAVLSDKSSPEYQRMSRDALRKSITGIVNRVNMRAQAASLPFTPVFAALVAILNSKLPQVGEQVLTRLISQFRRTFKRNDKVGQFSPSFVIITDSCLQIVCHSTTTFIAHLVNQSVAHEIIAPTFSIGWKPSHTK
jgi:pre-mRNA-splicing factor CWC22